MDTQSIQQVRSFNRMVAERVGAVNDRFLGRGRPMTEARLIWEIGTAGSEIRELRQRLGLDSGFVSRVLDSLVRQGLVVVDVSPSDRRVRCVKLTAAGHAEWAELDRRSDDVARRFLEPLDEWQRARLVAAMADVERLLSASLVTISIEDPTSEDAHWCIEQYFAELSIRFDSGFDPALTTSADALELILPAGLLLVARLRNRPVGCVALKFHTGGVAELKRMWLAQSVRGIGLGARLLREGEEHAAVQGATVIHLETNRNLTEAIALYRRCGYREVAAFNDERYAHHWFEKRLDEA
jgi:DNA-binding MarR family transcriptional regulator/GNAT superfamily N-acetyltransferase